MVLAEKISKLVVFSASSPPVPIVRCGGWWLALLSRRVWPKAITAVWRC